MSWRDRWHCAQRQRVVLNLDWLWPVLAPMITIVDYGMGNLRSVQKAFERVGHAATITPDPEVVASAERLVLPGVGAFRDAIARLRSTGMDQPIRQHIHAGKPFLGICLGLQLLFTKSFEDGEYDGLDILPGEVVRFQVHRELKVPHMGWNELRIRRPAPIFHNLPGVPSVYFVHSFFVKPRDASLTIAEADYPTPFTAAIGRERLFGTQFHPEKSQRVGLAILHNFAELG
jgi:glutamine amidotransferase